MSTSSLRSVIHAALAADARVTALLGLGEELRHYPERAPQGAALPYLVSNEVSGVAATTHGVEGDPEDTLDQTQIQFTAFGASVSDSIAVRAAVRAALVEDVAGLLAAARVVVASVFTRFLAADEVGLHGAQLDLTFFHNPST